jgi:hypothetical protein
MEIVRNGSERIADLRPLWESLSRHHAKVAPELVEVFGELRPEEDSWAVRRGSTRSGSRARMRSR